MTTTTARPARSAAGPTRAGPLRAVSALIAALLAVPLVFLLIEAQGSGAGQVWHLIARPLTAQLLWNTVRLTVTVTVLCAIIGTAAAWCTERTDLPVKALWRTLLVVPLAVPDFVVSFGWHSLWSWASGFRGAVIVMTLAVYPLVYLPAAASFRTADPGQEEVARSLGAGRFRTFIRITLGQARTAIAGGSLLVALVILAEYGAFEILGYRTFTTEIFAEFNSYSFATSCALSLVLVVLGLLTLTAEGAVTRHQAPAAKRTEPRRYRLGKAKIPVLLAHVALIGLALGVPVYASVYWITRSLPPALSGGSNVSMLNAATHTALYGAAAAALATVAAIPVGLLATRHPSRSTSIMERSTYLVLAMPGVVIAFALYYFTERYASGFAGGTAALLVVAYAIMFFPLALVGVRASLARAPAGLEEIARSLGKGRCAATATTTLRLAAPGLAAAFCLVFLSAVTELTATLLLIPAGTQTLATQFWKYEQSLSYSQAAPFALVMIIVAALPSVVLARRGRIGT